MSSANKVVPQVKSFLSLFPEGTGTFLFLQEDLTCIKYPENDGVMPEKSMICELK